MQYILQYLNVKQYILHDITAYFWKEGRGYVKSTCAITAVWYFPQV